MSQSCDQSCSSCAEDCADRKENPTDFTEKPHAMSAVKKVIGVVSGKGGVGKSLVTSLLAVTMQRRGYKTGILDADITGPSIPRAFGIKEKAKGTDDGLFPSRSKTGIDVMSLNLLIDKETDPVIWRGPMIANMVKQFWSEVIWGDIDYLFVDMPPGTGDVPLTVFQSLPIDGVIIVTSPQELVSMIVEKAAKMATIMNIPILGLVENMSYFKCSGCDMLHQIFGESHIEKIASDFNIKTLGKMPMEPGLAALCDKGMIELFEGDWLEAIADVLDDNGGNR